MSAEISRFGVGVRYGFNLINFAIKSGAHNVPDNYIRQQPSQST